ncbi:hypothetical protein [Paraflavitalea speifideaquila]|uniref:hypothetical protein n=1 Tax=Paraflavitalea speifideaquila TaxID=3076558 RepID=UPI0028E2A493|nr:hypothetical protein [Paraflavitalea speifideiaquila]
MRIISLVLLSIFLATGTQAQRTTSSDSSKPFVMGLVDELWSKQLGEKEPSISISPKVTINRIRYDTR